MENASNIDRVKKLLDAQVISLRNLEQSTGYSRTAISQFFSGSYKGDRDRVQQAIERWYMEYERRHSLAETSIFKNIQLVLELTWQNMELAVVYGNAGIGKTVSCEYYADEHPDDVVYVKMDRTLTAIDLLNVIMEGLGESTQMGSLFEKKRQILKSLRMRNKMLLIDEADLLNVKQLEILRAIYDDGNCAMVLIGLERIIVLMTRGETLRENLAQLYSRVGFKRHVLKPTPEDIRIIARRRGIALSAPAINQLQEWINDKGQLRILDKILSRSEELAQAENHEFEESYLKQAYGLLLGA